MSASNFLSLSSFTKSAMTVALTNAAVRRRLSKGPESVSLTGVSA